MSKTITDIIPPSRRRQMEGGVPSDYTPPTPSYNPPPPPRPVDDRPYRPSGGNRKFPWGVALVALVVVVASAAALYAFADAKVTITPKTTQANVTGSFTASLGNGDLPFELVSVSKTVTANVPAESTETVNDPAHGTITIYNGQSSSQTLIKNTRFQTSDGKIFRIQDSVTIPGGSQSSPGSIQATVYADTGGDQYNIGPTTFTVPGPKGSAAFDLVTAKSTSAFTGGFAGTRPSVSSDTDAAQADKNKSALNEALNKAVADQLPAGYVVLPGATFITYGAVHDSAGKKDSTVDVNLDGTAVAVAFPAAALAKTIAYQVDGSYSGQNVMLADPSTLKLTPATPGAPATDQQTFAFSLSGPASIIYQIDADKIAGAIAGKTRDAAYTILKGFPEVDHAVLTVRPFWSNSFPSDPAKINIATTTAAE